MKERVFITGMGVINSIADSVVGFERSLKEGRQGIGFFQNRTTTASMNIGAEIRDFSFGSMLESFASFPEVPDEAVLKAKKGAARAPFAIQVALSVLFEAYIQAKLFQRPVEPDKLGIVVAGSNLTNPVQAGYAPKFQQHPEYLSPLYALQFMDTDHIGTLSDIFQIAGEGFTVGGASASGNLGIIKAYQLIQLGIVEAGIVIGAMADLTDMELQGFYNIGALGGKKFHAEPGKACRPFDRDHEGFIYGQAGGCLVLESFASIQRRDISPLAEILGGVVLLDGNRLSDPSENGEVKAMESALKQAGITAQDIDYINTHGTSSPLGDATELSAIKRVFTQEIGRIWINATKGLTGHCLFAAGVVEAIASVIQMNAGFIHPNLNLENPIDPEFRFGSKTATAAQINTVISNSFGFGGINTAVVLRKAR